MAAKHNNWLYENSCDNSARYILGQAGDSPLVCIGINPSTAEPNNLDRTLTTVKRLAELNGYRGWLMLNVYPQRATNPNALHEDLDHTLHSTNLRYISKYLTQYNTVDVWAAWGTLIHKRNFLPTTLCDIVKVLNNFSIRWVTIGKSSKAGHPHHPLYLSHKCPIEPFKIHDYLKNLL